MIGVAAKTSELDFGRKHLFDPLDIKDVVWGADPQGRSHGWGDSHFYPRDIAKLGYLYLHGGEWKGKQIVPRDWVTMSIAPATGPRTEPGGFGLEWNATNGPNGRQYGGNGRGGQSLIVWPELDMIVVSHRRRQRGSTDAAGQGSGQGRSAASCQRTGKRPVARARLPRPPDRPRRVRRRRCRQQRPRSRAGSISFPINSSRIDSLALTFAKDGTAMVDLAYYGKPLRIPIGLDGVYRIGPHGPFGLPAGATGSWRSETEFLLDVNFIANINHYTLAIAFLPDRHDRGQRRRGVGTDPQREARRHAALRGGKAGSRYTTSKPASRECVDEAIPIDGGRGRYPGRLSSPSRRVSGGTGPGDVARVC